MFYPIHKPLSHRVLVKGFVKNGFSAYRHQHYGVIVSLDSHSWNIIDHRYYMSMKQFMPKFVMIPKNITEQSR